MYSEEIAQLEDRLCEFHQRRSVLLTGGGTAAIYLALMGLGLRNQWIALPNNVCMNVVLPILYSGNKPYYLDIELQSLGMDPYALLNCPVKLGAALVPHMYGSVCQIDQLKRVSDTLAIPLIEDFAQAQGATYKGKPVGFWGDISIGSFGSGKMIDVEHGGCLFTDSHHLMSSIRELNKKLPPYAPNHLKKIEHLGTLFNKLYNQHFNDNPHVISKKFLPSAMKAKSAFLFQFEPRMSVKILHLLERLPNELDSRKEKYRKIQQAFEGIRNIEVFLPPEGSVHWRANLFLSKNRDIVLRSLLNEKQFVSSWFPSVSTFFEDEDESEVEFVTPVSDQVGKTILNLWVNNQVDESYVEIIKRKLLKVM